MFPISLCQYYAEPEQIITVHWLRGTALWITICTHSFVPLFPFFFLFNLKLCHYITELTFIQLPTPRSFGRSASTASSSQSSPFLLSNVPHSNQPAYHVFGTGSTHPFANYWTTQGGLPEVIGVLPTKDQADTLVAKYFEAVDPVYPMLHKEEFYSDYDEFWTMPHEQKCVADASFLALQFAIYAMGAQFLQMESDQARQQISEFYVSAAHQSLRLYPFLSKTSLRSIEAMVLIAYFLMNDNKATDAWAFTGLLVKQAYAMGLHRDPNLIVPNATAREKNQRRKLWYSVVHQDTFLTVLVKLPPTSTFSGEPCLSSRRFVSN